jgi:hypothetical protein
MARQAIDQAPPFRRKAGREDVFGLLSAAGVPGAPLEMTWSICRIGELPDWLRRWREGGQMASY